MLPGCDRQYFQKAISTRKPFISDILISKATRRPIVIIGHPIMDERGTVIGVLIGSLIMAVLLNGMTLLAVSPEIKFIARGTVLVLAVWMVWVR